MKISIIYHSESGNTKKVADIIAEGAKLDGKVDVKAMSIDEIDETFVQLSDAVIIGSPTHRGTYSWQMRKWLGTTKLKVAGKLGSVFATGGHIGGGTDIAEMGMIGQLLVLGMLIYSAGASEGQPFTHFGAVAIKGGDEPQIERARIFGERISRKALDLFGK
jgi:NAD(P)H dehydrogenase (quinone)